MTLTLATANPTPWAGWFNRDLIENMPVAVYVCDATGVLVAYNRKAATLWGRAPVLGDSQQKFCGAHRLHLSDGTYVPHHETPLALVIETHLPYAFEAMVGRPDGTLRNVSANVAPLFDDQQNFIGFVNCVLDITEQKQQQTALRAAEDALRQSQKMEAIGQLTGGVAHDFNNYLTVIRGSADILKLPNLSAERRMRYVAAISGSADRAAKLTGQLLAFSRRQALSPEVFDVGQGLQALRDMIATLVGARVSIDYQLPLEACFVDADPGQLDTVLVNMIVNARDALAGSGRISICVSRADGIPEMRAHAARAGDFVRIAIRDSGCGIAPDVAERIFEPFFTTKPLGEGTGLGLSQVFGFAKQSGGDIMVESVPGQGSTFTLYLPRCAAPRAAAVPEQGALAASVAGRRILVVDDNEDVGEFAKDMLYELGYSVVLVASGQAALEALADAGPAFDLVFSDLEMPGMSGMELAGELRRRHPQLPVLLTSGYSHVHVEQGLNGIELLQKPYAFDQLAAAIARHLPASPRFQ